MSTSLTSPIPSLALPGTGAPLALPAAPSLAAPAAGSPAEKARVVKVAKQFEAIFVRQMLAEARKTQFDNGEDNVFGQKDQTFREMQDARFADIAADKGTFGLAKMIEKQLMARSGQSVSGQSVSGQSTPPIGNTGS